MAEDNVAGLEVVVRADGTPRTARATSKLTHQKNRARLRSKLRKAGYNESYIERAVAQKRDIQLAQREVRFSQESQSSAGDRAIQRRETESAAQWQERKKEREKEDREWAEAEAEATRQRAEEMRERAERETYERLCPDDSAFRPTPPDPLTVGPSRVTKTTAKVARSGKTILRTQYHEAERRKRND